MILIPLPFFILGAAVIAVNGKVVEGRELDILQQSIKGVRLSQAMGLFKSD